MAASLMIEQGPYYETLRTVTKSQGRLVALCLTKREDANILDLKASDLYEVGVAGRVLRVLPSQGQGAQIFLSLEKRIRLVRPIETGSTLQGQFIFHTDQIDEEDDLIKAYSTSLLVTIKELLKLNPLFKEELQVFLGHSDFTDPGKLADFSVALTTAGRKELQEVLEAFDIKERYEKTLHLLKKELDLSLLQNSIAQKIESNITKSQKEYFLREQLKTIKKELGLEKEDKLLDIEKFEKRLEKLLVPPEVLEVIEEEIDKLSLLDTQSAEHSVLRNYLDWLTSIPWGIYTKDQFDIEKAKQLLDREHFGLEDVKERILELIAIGKLTKKTKGKILCLVGPPGVGKTSLGKSIAAALGRKFYRFSVGGMKDEAEIKGHRRTYIGAMPGKLIQALKVTKSQNPVIMIDEIDKIGGGHGDPASALLEVLDPEQNSDFLDHYLDVPCSLSKVLFIVTANVLDTIPPALRDRMDVIRLSGYVLEEKVEIAERHLIPKVRKESGLKTTQVRLSKEAVIAIIDGYARESGLRQLEKSLEKIFGKIAKRIVEGSSKRVIVSEKNLSEFLKKPIFLEDFLYKEPPVGVAIGLAWTSFGGATLIIEVVKTHYAERTSMKVTGNVGEVMKESSQIAWTYFMSSIPRYAPEVNFFERSEIHIHVPEGATPKDGPSAGITMVTALYSLLLNRPIRSYLAMTGEITLTGKVLAVGGIKEKVIALRRSKLKIAILPKENQSDFEELPTYLKEGLEVHFVEDYSQVFPLVFP